MTTYIIIFSAAFIMFAIGYVYGFKEALEASRSGRQERARILIDILRVANQNVVITEGSASEWRRANAIIEALATAMSILHKELR